MKDYINSPTLGLAKRFSDVGERCYKDHLWTQQKHGKSDLAEMTELLTNADVCLIEISHEVDTRLLEFTKLKREWFQQLGKYLIDFSKLAETQSKSQIQVRYFEIRSKFCQNLPEICWNLSSG